MINVLHFDLETRSEANLKTCGSAVYARHKSTQIVLFLYAFNDDDVHSWEPLREPPPPLLIERLKDPAWAKAGWNIIGFDNEVIEHKMGITIPVESCLDGMVIAMMHNLPGSLKMAAKALGTQEMKDEAGKDWITLFSKPLQERAVLRRSGYLFADWTTHPEEWASFTDYGKQDVRTARDVIYRMPKWNLNESELERLSVNCAINRRGMHIDHMMVDRVIAFVEMTNEALNRRALEITGGIKPSQREKFNLWLRQQGVHLSDLRKDTVDNYLERTNVPPLVREVLNLSRAATSTSTAKFKVFKEYGSIDGIIRWMHKWYGAHTGRFSGAGPQVQNLPRGTVKHDLVEWFVAVMARGWTTYTGPDPIAVASSSLRQVIKAPPGEMFSQSDLSAIEGRGTAWIADEQWVLDEYTNGRDMYKTDYAMCFGTGYDEVTKDQRQQGKPINLAFGYAGGVNAFVAMARIYRIDLVEMANELYRKKLLPPDILDAARRMFYTPLFRKSIEASGFANDMRTWCALDAVKRMWRKAHWKTVKFWYDLDSAIRGAIDNPGQTWTCGRDNCLKIDVVRIRDEKRPGKYLNPYSWLRILLPSGRYLSYYRPELSRKPLPPELVGHDDEGNPIYSVAEEDQSSISFYAPNKAGGMAKKYSHAGVFTENIVQAFCRDILCEGIVGAEKNPEMTVRMHVHDEIIVSGKRDLTKELTDIMTADVSWAPGLPLGGEGWCGPRYCKD